MVKELGLRPEAVRDTMRLGCGDTGAAHALLMLGQALGEAEPGDQILVAAFGQGCDAVLFRVTDAIAAFPTRDRIGRTFARRKEENNYAKFQAFNHLVEEERGIRAEHNPPTALSALYRNKDMITGLVGGVCRECGTVQFPKSDVCVNPNCNVLHSQDDEPFAERAAKIMTWSADHLTYTPDPPAHYGMVQFEDGGRFMADITDHDPGGVEVGMPVRMVFRIRHFDEVRGFKRYFWKAAPIAAQS